MQQLYRNGSFYNQYEMKRRSILTIILVLFSIVYVCGEQYPLINNARGRQNIRSLDCKWQIIIDPYEAGTYSYHSTTLTNGFEKGSKNFSDYNTLNVPGDWNSQKEELLYYEGVVWYRVQFDYQQKDNKRVFIHFGAINYISDVYLNGQGAGKHVGGFTPFNYEVTQFLKNGANNLIVKVDNRRHSDGIPGSMYDWWNFGGITRPVTLIETPVTFIRDYSIGLSKDRKSVQGWVQLDGIDLNEQVIIDIPELNINHSAKTDSNGRAFFAIKAKPECWSPENPKLYSVNVISQSDNVSDRIGFRTIETRGNKIILNGEEIFLKGVNMHAQLHGCSAYSSEDAECLLGWAKEMGCNFVRLAHYPHSEETIRVAERLGIMVWEELPVYWAIQWNNLETYLSAETQLEDMISRDKNRANVIIWSVANETPKGDDRLIFLTRLASRAREIDNQRLISAALEPKEIKPNCWSITDKCADVVDVIGINQYIGWFNGTPEKCDVTEWELNLDKPYIMSEFGSSAPYNRHGDKAERYTEEYQEYYYEKTVEMIKRTTDLSGVCPWNLTEHRSPRLNTPGIEDGFSRAGLISVRGQRKKAFHVMKKYYMDFLK